MVPLLGCGIAAFGNSVGNVDAPFGDGRTCVAGTDFLAPENFGAFGSKCPQDAGFPPDGVAIGAQPLGPVIGVSARMDQYRENGGAGAQQSPSN
jgi:hypothetical protein